MTFPAASSYIRFLFENWRLLSFGLLVAMLSGFGQTFFIGLFNSQLRDISGLGQGELGLVYGGSTLASAALLTWLGGLYDQVNPRLYLAATMIFLMLGCLLLGTAAGTLALFLALFILRVSGQGLMVHISLTTMARRFHQSRGKAVSIAAMGMPLAEALFPALAVMAMISLEWHQIWLSGSLILLLLLPLILWLLGGRYQSVSAEESGQASTALNATRRDVLRDWRFILLIPGALSAPFVVTIVFFYQIPIVEAKGWGNELVASGLAMYAFGHVMGLLTAGSLVDRFTARRVFVPALLPLFASMLVLTLFNNHWAAMLWPAILGVGVGLNTPAMTSLLAELYGLVHLGAIRAMLQAMVVFSTAVGPPLFGVLLDRGIHTETLVAAIGISVLVAMALAQIALTTPKKRY